MTIEAWGTSIRKREDHDLFDRPGNRGLSGVSDEPVEIAALPAGAVASTPRTRNLTRHRLAYRPGDWIALLTLTTLEVVLGIDNIIFITILASKIPAHQQARGRQIGLGLAMVMRILLLLSISWVIGLTEPWFSIVGKDFSGRDLILIGGASFYR